VATQAAIVLFHDGRAIKVFKADQLGKHSKATIDTFLQRTSERAAYI
jgi:hypothetical protein